MSLGTKDEKTFQRMYVLPLRREAPDAEALEEDTVGA